MLVSQILIRNLNHFKDKFSSFFLNNSWLSQCVTLKHVSLYILLISSLNIIYLILIHFQSWIGEVNTKDNIDFMIENLNITINPDQRRTACFFVQYSSDFQPKLKSIFVNGREVCHASDTVNQLDKSNPRSINNGGNYRNRIQSVGRTAAMPLIKNSNNRTHHDKKVIRTTTLKPNDHIQTTMKRTQTSTRGIRNIQSVYATPKRKTQLFFLKKSKNNQHTPIVRVGNSTCISCKSNVNNESLKINKTEIGPAVLIQQEDNKDKHLQINIQTFNNLHTVENSNSMTTKIRGDNRLKSDNKHNSDSVKLSKNIFVTSDGINTRKPTEKSQSEESEILETSETRFITTHISTTTQIKGDNTPIAARNRQFNNSYTTDNVNLTTNFSTTTAIDDDDRLKIDNNLRFDYLHSLGNETLVKQIWTTVKIRDDNRSDTEHDVRFDTFYTIGNTNLTTQISTTTKIKGDDTKPKTEYNEKLDNLQTGQNIFTTEISTAKKIKDSHILKIANNNISHSLKTTLIPLTTISVSTTRRNEGENAENTKHIPITTTTTIETKLDDRSKIEKNNRLDSLGKTTNGYKTTTVSTTKNIKGDDRGFDNFQTATIGNVDNSKTNVGSGLNADDFEADNNEDGLDTLGVIGLPETSVRPQIDTTSNNIQSSHVQADVGDIFRLPTR